MKIISVTNTFAIIAGRAFMEAFT